jgi:hypothetical protein
MMKRGGIEMEEFDGLKADINNISFVLRTFSGWDTKAHALQGLFTRLLDRIEAIEKRLPPATDEGEKS